jgi:UDP:flavonoid glycosyltransferase YjiC (YdhE family)
MANIVIAPLYWQANMNVTFALARKLQRRGHRVHYACIPETEERIRAQSFDFVPIFSSVFPPGTLAAQFANEAAGRYLGAAGIMARVQSMCELCRDGEIGTVTSPLQPDLFLVSNHLPWAGIGAWKTGAPVIMFSSVLVSKRDAIVPPISSDTIPSSTLFSRLQIAWKWRKQMVRRILIAKASGLAKTVTYLTDLALSSGYPLSAIDFDVLPWPRLSLPELIFFPECFDFRRAKPIQGAFYAEPSVDIDRKDKDFPWEKLDGRPLVYCSLGSVITFKYVALAQRFFQALLDAMRQCPNLQAAVAIGDYLKPEDFKCPENVILTDKAPQVGMLKRAALMVGHGGGGGIRESIFYGVPLLLLPIGFDAPGNAARAVYHGLALRSDFRKASPPELKAAIDKLLSEPSYADAARRMSRKFVELQEQAPSVSVIERALAGKLDFNRCP